MSVEAPWLALACDWHESEMFEDATLGQRMAFIAMLCFSKSRGRAGRFTLHEAPLCRDFKIEVADLRRMIELAQEHGCIEFDGSVVQFTNWAVYQDPAKRRANLVKRDGLCKSSTTGPRTRTKDQGQDQGQGPDKKSDDVEAIYQLYPRKAGRRDALKAIAAALKRLAPGGHEVRYEVRIELLRDAVTAYAASPAGQPPPKGGNDYRPHPATWFNQGRYDDDRSEWQKPNGVDHGATDDRAAADAAELLRMKRAGHRPEGDET